MPDFNSIEEIDNYYQARIDDASEERKPALQLEMLQAQNRFYREQQTAAQVRDWKQQAIADFPHADPDSIRGSNLEEIRASAEIQHKRVQAAIDAAIAEKEKEILEKAGRQAYRGGSAGGGQQGGTRDDQKPDARRKRVNEGLVRDATRVRGGEQFHSIKSSVTPDEVQEAMADTIGRSMAYSVFGATEDYTPHDPIKWTKPA